MAVMLPPDEFCPVGVKGFEPSTPWSQTRCANRTALNPECVAKLMIFL